MKAAMLNRFAAFLFALSAGGLSVELLTACAGWGKTTCQVIDAAKEACTVVRYMDDDGREKEVRLSPEEARELGKAASARQAASRDGGR
jgi:hypothetical protein